VGVNVDVGVNVWVGSIAVCVGYGLGICKMLGIAVEEVVCLDEQLISNTNKKTTRNLFMIFLILITPFKIRRDQIGNIRCGILPCDREEVIRGGVTVSKARGVIS